MSHRMVSSLHRDQRIPGTKLGGKAIFYNAVSFLTDMITQMEANYCNY